MKHVKLFEQFVNEFRLNEADAIKDVSVVDNKDFGNLVAIQTSGGKAYLPQEAIDELIKALDIVSKPKWKSVASDDVNQLVPSNNPWVTVSRDTYQEDELYWANSITISRHSSKMKITGDMPKDFRNVQFYLKDVKSLIKMLKSAINEAYDGDLSDFEYDLMMAVDELGFSPKAIKKVTKTGDGYEVRMSSYMNQERNWQAIADEIGAELKSFKKDASINIGVFEAKNESKELTVTPNTFSRDERNVNKLISKIYRGTGLAAKIVAAIGSQMKLGEDSRIKSVTFTSDGPDSEIYIELTNGTIYDRANLEFDEVLADIQLIDSANVIAKSLIKNWSIPASTKDGREMHFVWLNKTNHDLFGKQKGHNLYDVLMKEKGKDYVSIGNAKEEREISALVRATRLFY